MTERQLPLAFPHRPQFLEVDFLPSDANRLALQFLAKPADWPLGRLVLCGAKGTGKTHLLHIWARAQGAAILHATALREPYWPEGAVAIDDIDQAPSEPNLLHVLNAAQETGQKLLLTSVRSPCHLPIELPDLASRLRAATSVQIGPADDDFLTGLLARLLAERQMAVAPAVQSWLLRRLPRTPGAVQDAVARLDRAALAAGAGVSRVLAAQVLEQLFHDNLITETL